MLYWLLALAIFLAWWNLLEAHGRDGAERILGAFILTITQMVWSLIALGLIHSISYWSVVGVNTVTLLAVVFWGRQGFRHRLRFPLHRQYTPFVKPPLLLVLAALLSLFAVGMVVWFGLRLPTMAYDQYHLVRAALAIQDGTLPPFAWDGMGVDYYPANAEMLFAWWLLGTGNDAWVCVAQVPFGLAMALAVYLLARQPVGASWDQAAFCALLVFSMPVVLHQMWHGLSDVMVAGCIWAAWAFVGRRRLDAWSVTLAGLSAAWALGTKPSALYWVLGIILWLGWRVVRR